MAEDTGLIIDASRWALRESCMFLKRISQQIDEYSDLFMSINFSSTDFAEENFLDHLYTIISETDTDPKKISLEITERLLMKQPENAKMTLDLCKKAGLGIAIDDFGTGYSSLSYLHYYPIDKLKVDQTFIRNMENDPSAKELVRSIIMLGNNMNMTTVAEGVETEAEAKIIREMGCSECQGYFIARPASETDIISLLQNWNADEKIV